MKHILEPGTEFISVHFIFMFLPRESNSGAINGVFT